MFKTILLTLAGLLYFVQAGAQSIDKLAESLASAQLEAYNNRDIEAFLIPYAEDVKVFNFPDTLQYQGIDEMRKRYTGMFENTPDLHCKLINRMVMGNTVIDQEEVIIRKGEKPIYAIAIYKIKDDKIAEVYFISKKE